MENKLNIISFDEIEVTNINRLWYLYTPFGKITLIHEDPGEGKTTLALQIASLLSKREKLPFIKMIEHLSL